MTLVTGSHHYQVYWVPSTDDPASRDIISVPVVWRIAEREWIPRSAAFLNPPDRLNREMPWGLVCIKCHATGGRPGLELETDYVELGIACEACHGPAEAHIAHYQNPVRRYLAHLGDDSEDSVVDPAQLPESRGSEICAQCHSLLVIPDSDGFIANGTPFRPGDPIAEHFPEIRGETQAEAQRAQSFWSDGEIR
ncbi:MAG: hypothetical protein KC616_26660, partial [Myxococcales bacterium]|nr:hypothetical protein [Myxococcales bacterium]